MNIFCVHDDPRIAAQMLCDKHVVKMVLESAQLMSTTYQHFGWPAPYKPTHRNHPCAVWLRAGAENYEWLREHARALAAEYTFRYGKRHKSAVVIDALWATPPFLPAGGTPHPQCVPDTYKSVNAVDAYRAYYIGDKASIATWNRGRPAPEWWSQGGPHAP